VFRTQLHKYIQEKEYDEMDLRFHAMLELFFRYESHKLMDIMECPIQRFLVYTSVGKGAKGFIRVRDIGTLIAKLIYGIRCSIFNEFIVRCAGRLAENKIDGELAGLMIYARDLLQTPLGFVDWLKHCKKLLKIPAVLDTLPENHNQHNRT
jgi:hypothetical protein